MKKKLIYSLFIWGTFFSNTVVFAGYYEYLKINSVKVIKIEEGEEVSDITEEFQGANDFKQECIMILPARYRAVKPKVKLEIKLSIIYPDIKENSFTKNVKAEDYTIIITGKDVVKVDCYRYEPIIKHNDKKVYPDGLNPETPKVSRELGWFGTDGYSKLKKQ
jgi:hypothetical protein